MSRRRHFTADRLLQGATIMSFRSLNAWLKAAPRPRNPRRGDPAPRVRFLPRLEVLECRNLLSTLAVLNIADSGAGSLRDTIAAARSGDRIVFDPSLVGQTITLTSGELAIDKSLTLRGPGADQLTISGNKGSRVFD